MSALRPIASLSLTEGVFSKLIPAITGGEFGPGERLAEAELAAFGINRGPLREALGRLQGRLVVRTPGRGLRGQPGDDHRGRPHRAHCRSVLAFHKVPKAVFFLDALPKTTSGKVAKTELVARLVAGAA